MQSFDAGDERLTNAEEEFIFKLHQALLRAGDGLLQFLEFRRDVALGVGKRLLALVAIRHEMLVGFGHIDIIAEHAVIADLQVFNAGCRPLLRLHAREPLLAVARSFAQRAHLAVVAFADDAAIFNAYGRLIDDRVVEQRADVRHYVEAGGGAEESSGMKLF